VSLAEAFASFITPVSSSLPINDKTSHCGFVYPILEEPGIVLGAT
jgi:hypothetical protein